MTKYSIKYSPASLTKYLLPATAAIILTIGVSSCIQEYEPTDEATSQQLEHSDKGGLSRAIGAYMTDFSQSYSYDVGFPGFGIWRDAMTADLTVTDQSWDYFNYYPQQTFLGNYQLQSTFWERYYALIQKANLLIGLDDGNPSAADRAFIGNALVYRASAYLDLQRMYEFRPTGVGYLDAAAESRGILGLTVPIVTDRTSEAEARENPRAPYWHLYRFLLTDLTRAERYLLDAPAPGSKTEAGLGTCYGQLARTWLEIATRFDLHADHLAQALQHEDDPELADLVKFSITDSRQAYANAADYARKAITAGYSPMSESQWRDPATGFNTPNQAWMWCITITPNDLAATWAVWQSFVSFMSTEADYGVCNDTYLKGRMIDNRLFKTIDPNDWRRATWIAPGETSRQKFYDEKYSKVTSLSFSEWRQYRSLVGFKFHPGGGNRTTSTIGNAVSIPLMRIEEMYLIEAEATAHSQGAGAGKSLLETFMNNYRMTDGTSYTSPSASLEDLTEEIFNCKRVELWGEGLILWDYCRLEHAIIRGYETTNHPQIYQFNSIQGRKAPWANFYIPDSESNRNRGVILNPDPSNAIPQWK